MVTDEVLEVPVAIGVVPADPPRPAALVDPRVSRVGGEERLLAVLEAQHDLGALGHGPSASASPPLQSVQTGRMSGDVTARSSRFSADLRLHEQRDRRRRGRA